MGKTIPIKDRFWTKVNKTEECWEWIATKNRYGYGIITIGKVGMGKSGKAFMAHRISYELTYGEFDKSLFVCHHCDNPSCVRPDHLFLGTQTDNMRDCANKGRTKGTFDWTKNQHPLLGKKRPAYIGETLAKVHQKPFKVIDPSGNLIEGINLTKFCRERGLNRGNMRSVIKGTVPSCKGYTKA